MIKSTVAAALLLSPTSVLAAPTLAEQADEAIERDAIAWNFVEGITTEVGPRQAGTEAEARGRDWAVRWLKAKGFANVAVEPYVMDTWIPGDVMRAAVVGPYPQPLAVVPLGNSAATPVGGLTAEVVRFASYNDLVAAPAGKVAGDPFDVVRIVPGLGELIAVRIGELDRGARTLRDVIGARMGPVALDQRVRIVGRVVELLDQPAEAGGELGLEQAFEHGGLECPVEVEIGAHGNSHPVEMRGEACDPAARGLRAAGR